MAKVPRGPKKRVSKWLADLARAAAGFVYPPVCRWCQGELPEFVDEPLAPLCEKCMRVLCETHGRSCLRCGAAIGPNLDPTRPCHWCHKDNFAFERVIRLGVYEGALRGALLCAKQPQGEPLAAALADLVWAREREALEGASGDVVLPVPQHWFDRLARRHHAAETMAVELGRRLHLPVALHILRKTRRTRPQASLSPHERRVNLRGALAVDRHADLSGASVLLADDVMTTGTTAHECARVLKRAGAARVTVVVLARGLGKN